MCIFLKKMHIEVHFLKKINKKEIRPNPSLESGGQKY